MMHGASVVTCVMRRCLHVCFFALAIMALSLPAQTAHAYDGMGLGIFKGLFEFLFLLFGVAALLSSVALGALAWMTAFRPPKSSALVFGRGFIGVAAIVTFFIGGVSLSMGIGRKLGSLGKFTAPVVILLTGAFLAIEFFVAGTLYLRVYRERKSVGAVLFCGASYAFAGVLMLFTLLGLVSTMFS
jgi:hypothetical protein